jgi:hypothetical protein
VALTGVDPGALQLMRVSSELMDAHAVIRRQRRQLSGLMAALKVAQQANTSLTDLLDVLLADDE